MYVKAKAWAAAAEAYRAALARSPDNAAWHARLGRALERGKQWGAAARAYEAALALEDRTGWHGLLGRARARAQEWEGAAEAFEAAAAREPDNRYWHVRAEQAREHARRWRGEPVASTAAATPGREGMRALRRERRERSAARLAEDPGVTTLDRRLLAAGAARLDVRRTIAHLIADHLDAIRAAADAGPRVAADGGPKVFVYWAQGIEHAPAVVGRCHEALRRLHAEHEVVALDADAVSDYVELPDHVTASVGDDWTKLSDVLRVALVSRYGGVWLDATCLPRVNLPEALGPLLRSGFFAFTVRRARPTSWFLASEPGGYIASMLREAGYEYWRHYDRPIDYYLFHHIFEGLFHVDRRFRELWEAAPKVPRAAAIAFRRAMYAPYEPERYQTLLDGCFVHKLTYKYEADAVLPGSMLAHLLADGAPPPARRAEAV